MLSFTFIGYLLLQLLLLLFLIALTIYTIFLIYSSLAGSPYLSTSLREINNILKEANLKENKLFVDLGCGDGRVVRLAVKNYQVKGLGIDINPLLIWEAKIFSKFQKIRKNISFYCQNIFNTDLNKADYIYLFLLPALIEKLVPKFERELKKDVLVISHGFKIKSWEKKLIKTLSGKPFSTYFYRFK